MLSMLKESRRRLENANKNITDYNKRKLKKDKIKLNSYLIALGYYQEKYSYEKNKDLLTIINNLNNYIKDILNIKIDEFDAIKYLVNQAKKDFIINTNDINELINYYNIGVKYYEYYNNYDETYSDRKVKTNTLKLENKLSRVIKDISII